MQKFVLSVLGIAAIGLSGPASGQVNDNVLNVENVRAFPKLKIVRPIILTHAGDGSDRIFVASQLGTIHVFQNDQSVRRAKVFLNIKSQVKYKKEQNEEGLLGLAFHPKYKENGEFFVYYTTTKEPHTSVISRFKVSDDPAKADPKFEEVIMTIKQPFWNHNGGTIVFGPDGYLYVGLGDGGARNDPMGNGQNLKTLLGSILRIDIDHKDEGKGYAIPKDNPFVDTPEARPEIYAYGLRNVWRMAFDRKTGKLWVGDVGQDIWEEIDIVVKGGNYGWNLRESRHAFGPKGVEANEKMIEPIWEYHHDVGKSITGGTVYRGDRVKELKGAYLYADYVAGQIWALWYDEDAKRVVANRQLKRNRKEPIISFGEDQSGDVYYTVDSGEIYRFKAGS